MICDGRSSLPPPPRSRCCAATCDRASGPALSRRQEKTVRHQAWDGNGIPTAGALRALQETIARGGRSSSSWAFERACTGTAPAPPRGGGDLRHSPSFMLGHLAQAPVAPAGAVAKARARGLSGAAHPAGGRAARPPSPPHAPDAPNLELTESSERARWADGTASLKQAPWRSGDPSERSKASSQPGPARLHADLGGPLPQSYESMGPTPSETWTCPVTLSGEAVDRGALGVTWPFSPASKRWMAQVCEDPARATAAGCS